MLLGLLASGLLLLVAGRAYIVDQTSFACRVYVYIQGYVSPRLDVACMGATRAMCNWDVVEHTQD